MNLEALRAFRLVAEKGSFTRAAAELRLDKSQVSRVIRELESSLGLGLFARTTRSVRLTAEGEALLSRVAPHLAGIEEALEQVPEEGRAPQGEVGLSTTPDIARALLAPALGAFRRRYPLVRVRLHLGAAVVDLTSERIDLALRVGRPGGQGLVARRLGELAAGFFAAPAYLERRGTPTSLGELRQHDGLWPEPPKGQRSFAPSAPIPPPTVACSDFQVLAELAKGGAGIALLPTFLAAAELRQGQLVRVIPSFQLKNAPLYLVSRPVRPVPARVAVLRSFLIEAELVSRL